MKFKREYLKLTQLVDFIVDNRGKTVPTVNLGIPLIATNCIKHSSIYPSFDNLRYISQRTFDTWFRSHLEPNDILLVNKGTPGRVCIVPNPVNFVAAQDMVGLRFRSEFHPFYMLAVLRSNEIQQVIRNNHVGLVIPHYRKQELLKLKLPILDKEKRDLIGNLYYILSEKIELNNKINAELETMAKLIYDYWFVQFDFPDENGKPYKSNGGKMVWSEELKREIPEGWKVGSLLDIAFYTNGLPCQKYRPVSKKSLPVIKIREMHEGFSKDTELVREDFPEKAIVKDGDVLFSWSASLEVQVWTGGKGGLNQHIFKVTSQDFPRSFYYFQLLDYVGHFRMMAENRKTTMGHITQDHLRQSRIILPSKQIIESLDSIIDPMINNMVTNLKQNQKLTELRDWILPMLMNGQVKVVS